MDLSLLDIKEFLDEKVLQYNNTRFIESDPVQIPHQFSKKEDVEIAGFLTATIAWGNRRMIINNAQKMMGILGNSPFDFIMNYSEEHVEPIKDFVHRTFNRTDLIYFLKALQHIYRHHDGLESIFKMHAENNSLQHAIHQFKKIFFELEYPLRTAKHISDPSRGSAAKRMNMFLR